MAVEHAVVHLVRVGHQAVVAGGLAVLPGSGGVPEVLPRLRVEVADAERFGTDPRQGARIVEQASEDTGAALGGLVEEDQAPVVTRREGLGGELVVLQLENHLNGVLERGLE